MTVNEICNLVYLRLDRLITTVNYHKNFGKIIL